MTDAPILETEFADGCATMWLNRPERLNALNVALIRELASAPPAPASAMLGGAVTTDTQVTWSAVPGAAQIMKGELATEPARSDAAAAPRALNDWIPTTRMSCVEWSLSVCTRTLKAAFSEALVAPSQGVVPVSTPSPL